MRFRTSGARLVAIGLLASLLVGGASVAAADPDLAAADEGTVDATGAPRGDWSAVGPNSIGGLLGVSASPNRLAVMQPGPPTLWVSEDRGRNWAARRTLPADLAHMASASGFVVDRNNPDHMLVTLNKRLDGSLTDWDGYLLSTNDAGRSWQVLREWRPDGAFELTAGKDGRTLVVRGRDVTSVSTDGGANWRDIPREWNRSTFAAGLGDSMMSLVGDDVYVVTVDPEYSLWVIHGATGASPRSERVYQPAGEQVGQVVANGRQLVVTVGAQVRGSRDNGRTWQVLRTDPDKKPLHGLRSVNGKLYAGTYDALDVSADGGRTWARHGVPAAGEGTSDIADLPGEHGGPATTLVSAVYRGVYAIDGGGYRSLGLPGETIGSLITAGSGRRQQLLAGGVQDVFRTELPRDEITPGTRRDWARQVNPLLQDHPRLSVSPKRPEVVWKLALDGLAVDVSRSSDSGATWSLLGKHLTGTPRTLLAHPADPDRLLVTAFTENGDVLYLSTDAGKTWKTVSMPASLTALAGDPRDPQRVWGGNENDGLFRSDDGGLTWTNVSTDPVGTITVDPKHSERVLVGGNGLLLSTDSGRSFQRVRDGGGDIRQVAVNPRDSRVWYAARVAADGIGVLRSTDAGRTWSAMSTKMTDSRVLSLAVSGDGRWLFAGTLQSGVYRLRLC
ncbi:peptidase S8/S53 subtilisin kexin sedolisin [Solihabitans fulvus]|uniref:Peptidase S8/S53 subtilisin kexin sedolisin n=1 Tax=Solihabitans fulvus TaxID=1892852 RepID=A0A5B2XDA3_9PSEU|nr:peptidase S8/S53 subtilisin kexin sedolisin [Solihabitans fulvus]KAA2261313.1 peptidase S8/S53 subtilisin kexin sedolisin [Solihabitans fulvus]